MPHIEGLRTGVWHGDHPLALDFPEGWEVTAYWPRTPPPLDDAALRAALERPIGQPPIRELCRGKLRPVIIVDDLCRPTPAFHVMPFVLEQFRQGGIAAREITIVMATGAHGVTAPDWLAKKVGREAASMCRLVTHDSRRRGVRLGTTPAGTPVIANGEVAAADFLVGIGGIYPSDNTGFGGGAKLALGVLSRGSIAWLHNRHPDVGWGVAPRHSSFRDDLEAVSRLLRLDTIFTLHINPHREVVRATCGDHYRYFPDEVAYARETFAAPLPGSADVVISNAYPNDLSLTFARSKGMVPFLHAPRQTSRIAIAACSEGAGVHGLFPFFNVPLLHARRVQLQRLAALGPGAALRVAAQRLLHKPQAQVSGEDAAPAPRRVARSVHPLWLYRTAGHAPPLPRVRGVEVSASWAEIINTVWKEQGGRRPLRVALYPCAPLQCFDA